jgi:hypothetical protein
MVQYFIALLRLAFDLKLRTAYFWNLPFSIFRLRVLHVIESSESEAMDKEGTTVLKTACSRLLWKNS